MSALRYLAYKTRATKGKEHLHWLELLRNYIKNTDMETLVREVETITTDEELKAIQEAGARGELYNIIRKKLGGVE